MRTPVGIREYGSIQVGIRGYARDISGSREGGKCWAIISEPARWKEI